MRTILKARTMMLLLVIAMLSAACAADDPAETGTDLDAPAATDDAAAGADTAATEDDVMATDDMATEDGTADDMATEDGMADDMATEGDDMATDDMATEGDDMAMGSADACDPESITAAVEGGPEDGTLSGMADDPVATAASNNPVLTTLATAVEAAGLGDTLNSAEALTVFAPTDCAFAEFDQATLEAALADPDGLLTTVLGFHVIADEEIASADLSGEYTTFTGETIVIEGDDVDGQATIVVGDIETANATVHLIDTVMVPPSVSGADMDADMDADATEDATEG